MSDAEKNTLHTENRGNTTRRECFALLPEAPRPWGVGSQPLFAPRFGTKTQTDARKLRIYSVVS